MSINHGSRSIPFIPPSAEEVVRARADLCQSLVDTYLSAPTRPPIPELIQSLQSGGATTDEVEDYINQVEQRLSAKMGKQRIENKNISDDEEIETLESKTPEGLTDAEIRDYREKRDEISNNPSTSQNFDEHQRAEAATNSVAWANLAARIQSIPQPKIQVPSNPSIARGISSSILALAPHLQFLNEPVKDEVLARTWELRHAFCADSKTLDSIIDAVQIRSLLDPLPRSVWKDIAQDRLVDFEKLHACLTRPSYDLQDDPKDFSSNGDYVLIRKDQTSAKKPVHTSSEWSRLFAAWEAGVLTLYPH